MWAVPFLRVIVTLTYIRCLSNKTDRQKDEYISTLVLLSDLLSILQVLALSNTNTIGEDRFLEIRIGLIKSLHSKKVLGRPMPTPGGARMRISTNKLTSMSSTSWEDQRDGIYARVRFFPCGPVLRIIIMFDCSLLLR